VVEGEHAQLRPLDARGAGAVQAREAGVLPRLAQAAARARNTSSSTGVGMAGAQPWRATTSAPQPLARRQQAA
jgi:hypothetical protein